MLYKFPQSITVPSKEKSKKICITVQYINALTVIVDFFYILVHQIPFRHTGPLNGKGNPIDFINKYSL